MASLSALLLLGAWGEVTPAERAAPVAVYVDTVGLPALADWRQVGHAVAANETVDEFVPAGQSAAAWSQIITIKTLPRTRDPRAIVVGAVALMREICGAVPVINTARRQEIGDAVGAGGPVPVFDAAETLVTCKNPDVRALRRQLGTDRVTLRRYEVTWYKMIWASRANFIVQRAWHGDDIDSQSVLGSRGVLDSWKKWITQVTLLRRRVRSEEK